MPIRTFSPMIASTDTSMLSPIMMLWFDLRVKTSIQPPCFRQLRSGRERTGDLLVESRIEHIHPSENESVQQRPAVAGVALAGSPDRVARAGQDEDERRARVSRRQPNNPVLAALS